MHKVILCSWNKRTTAQRGRWVPFSYPHLQHKRVRARGGYCVEISGYMTRILVERVSCPQWKRKTCSSLVTASMNEKQLRGMLHYHPISSTGGGELVVSLHLAVCRIMSLQEERGASDIGPQTHKWVEQLLPRLTRPCTSSFVSVMHPFLSAINLQPHPPTFIPFALSFSFTSCSFSLE